MENTNFQNGAKGDSLKMYNFKEILECPFVRKFSLSLSVSKSQAKVLFLLKASIFMSVSCCVNTVEETKKISHLSKIPYFFSIGINFN